MQTKAILIDDEKMARSLLADMLAHYCPEVQIVEEVADLPNGVKAIRRHKPDLVFLDIEMPGHSGLELLDFFEEEELRFQIVFVTAYHQYAIRAFKLAAVDYLLKPLEAEALQTAVQQASKRREPIAVAQLRHNLQGNQGAKLAVHTVSAIHFIPLTEILYFKASGSYTEVVLSGQTLLSSRNLKYFEETLSNDPGFVRCHKSFMVNTAKIDSYVKSDGGYLLVSGHTVALSPDKMEEVLGKVEGR
jgi:two-component system LytT family response regulator